LARIEKEITVEAPLERIFNYIINPINWPEFWPSLIDIRDVKSLPNGGYHSRWTYKMAGMLFEGIAQNTQVVTNQWLVTETKGGIKGTITWTFRAASVDSTRVTLTIEYRVPFPLLGKLAEAIIVRMNDQEADLIMANIRARFIP